MPIETRVISTEQEGWLTAAEQVLWQAGLVAFPTDTVYGLGGLAAEGRAVEEIYRAKGRPDDRSIPVLVSGWSEVSDVAIGSLRAARLAAALWPGPLTIVLPRSTRLPAAIGPGETVGVRAPNHPVALALLGAVGPLATSSANRSGGASLRLAAEVFNDLAGRIPLIIDGGRTPGGEPSTVVDCTGEMPQLVRAGPISLSQILSLWG